MGWRGGETPLAILFFSFAKSVTFRGVFLINVIYVYNMGSVSPLSNGYRYTGPGERGGSVNERLSHHQVVSGQLQDAQTSTPRPRTSMEKLRKPF